MPRMWFPTRDGSEVDKKKLEKFYSPSSPLFRLRSLPRSASELHTATNCIWSGAASVGLECRRVAVCWGNNETSALSGDAI